MRHISIGELHQRTLAWVRYARRFGAIVITDGGIPVAQLAPVFVSKGPAKDRFKNWRPRKKWATALDRPVAGRLVEEIISEDRNRDNL